ncbi:MAG: hypothetical protein RI897_1443 [Verrucomicrobiota bacterium]
MKYRSFIKAVLLTVLAVGGLMWSLVSGRGEVVINEIHFDPPLANELVEFVELHNTGVEALDLSGWAIAGGVDFVFPVGTVLGAGGYLVVAQDPASIQAKYGVAALGPWVGGLSNEGETVELVDASGRVVDEVDYQLGFPWPTVGDDPGYSIELLNPALDNSVGGHWRVSSLGGGGGPAGSLLVDAGSVWRYFKGTAEPSGVTGEWRQEGFDDSGWSEGAMAIGYGDGHVVTLLEDMRGGYSTVYFRRDFEVVDVAAVRELLLEVQYDDGVKVWINGVEVVSANMPGGEVPFSGSAVSALEDLTYHSYQIRNAASLIHAGTNVIAVQGANASLSGSSDFWVDLRLIATESASGDGPTPGAMNAVYTGSIPPAIRQVEHLPEQPVPGEVVTVRAKVTDADGVSGVTLFYQVVDPGGYIPLDGPEYDSDWVSVMMRDDGQGGDVLAGDSIYTVELSADVQVHRRLVRYRVEAVDGGGQSVLVPYPDDPVPNFAYFVYGGVPAWTGAVRPGDAGVLGQQFTLGVEEMNRLPVIQLIAERSTVEDATWLSRYGGDAYLWLGTLVIDGRVYDHVRYRARGGVWRYAMCKNMWKFDANRGHDFLVRDDWGRKYGERWRKLNLGASIQQGDYDHRGEQGLFESVGFRFFNLAGVPASRTTYAQLRVVDEAGEVAVGNQYEGDFWGVYLMVEQLDGRFLDEHGLPDGNLYKMEGGGGELNNLGPLGPDDKSDLNFILGNYSGATDAWWRANWDLEAYYSYQTIVQGIHHYDISDGKNYFYYHNPVTGQWMVVPWDLDLTWAHNMYRSDAGGAGVDAVGERLLSPIRESGTGLQSGTGVMRLSGSRPQIEIEFRNRIRELRDLLFNGDEGWRLVDEMAGRLRGAVSGYTILDADRAQWDYNPKMSSGTYSSSPGSKAGQGRYYQWPREPSVTKDFAGGVQGMKNYISTRSQYLDSLAADAQIPSTPVITYAGAAGYPANRIAFLSGAYSGVNAFGSQEWRVGAVTQSRQGSWLSEDPWMYEVDALWGSGELGVFQSGIDVPAGVLKPGVTYRARVRVKDQSGRASHWSAPVEFMVGPPDNTVALRESLRLTELMVDPVGGSDFEYVELVNMGDGVALDLAGAKFTSGVDFVFPAGATMAPGERVLVMRHPDAGVFRDHYGLAESVQVFGPFAGGLDNGGETLVLKASAGGEALVDFSYGDGRDWPLPAFGAGHSLVVLDGGMDGQGSGALDYPGNWLASTLIGGSPGEAEPVETGMRVVINEVAAHTDYADAAHPEYDSNDWIELVNAGGGSVSLADMYLSDDPGDLKKWALPVVILGAGERVSFDEVTGFHRPITSGFGLDKAGEQVLLSYLPGSGEDRVLDFVRFKGQENERAYGRYPDGAGAYRTLAQRTRDGVNTGPLSGLVITEVMYHPVDPDLVTDNTWGEFVELYNPTGSAVLLEEDLGAWRLDGGVAFTFPRGVVLGAGESLLVVGFDPTDGVMRSGFETGYGLGAGVVRMYGPFSGKLSNRSDRVGLERPQAADLPGDDVSWIVVDEVTYGNQGDWEVSANGGGDSLQRRRVEGYANDPALWLVAWPNPGVYSELENGDSDGDGLPDAYESEYGFLDAADPGDAALDYDGDGLSNREEYQAGTDPGLAASVLAVGAITREGAGFRMRVELLEGREYWLESTADLGSGIWQQVEQLVVPPGGGEVEVGVGDRSGGGYYRLLVTFVSP